MAVSACLLLKMDKNESLAKCNYCKAVRKDKLYFIVTGNFHKIKMKIVSIFLQLLMKTTVSSSLKFVIKKIISSG
jgi:diphthamide synthase subunit DPH2